MNVISPSAVTVNPSGISKVVIASSNPNGIVNSISTTAEVASVGLYPKNAAKL